MDIKKLMLFVAITLPMASANAIQVSQIEAYQMKQFVPGMMPDGAKQFYFIIPDYDRSTAQPGTDLDQLHEAWLGQEVGKAGYCSKGYKITSKTDVDGMLAYEGRCK